MQGMFWKILSEHCEFFVTRSAFLSTWRCSPGLRVYATAMESGQNIGTMTWQDRHRSSPTNQKKEMFRTVSARFMSNAGNVMNRFINIGFINLEATNPGRIDRFGFVSVLGFLVSWFPD